MFPAGVASGSAFPRVMAVATTSDNTVANDHALNMPSGIVSGELLLVIMNGAGVNQTPSGWSKMLENTGISAGELAIYTRTADGAEGATVTFNFQSGATAPAAAVAYRISGWSGVEGAIGSAVAANPDPPSHTASWGAAKTLWVAACACTRTGTTTMLPITQPSGYGSTQSSEATQALPNAKVLVGSAVLENQVATENPGAFSLSSSPSTAVAATVAVRPS